MVIETICQYPVGFVMGGSALLGALVNAGISVYKKKKQLKKKFKFVPEKLVDTVWQSSLAGASAGAALGCGFTGILIAIVTGIGVDKLANQLTIKESQVLNFVEIGGKALDKKFGKKS